MDIRLAHPPVAAFAPRFAADIVDWAKQRFGFELDYSVESLLCIDALLAEMYFEHLSTEDFAPTLWGLGCYVGEVFVRNTGAVWHDVGELPDATRPSTWMWIERDGTWINPIGKVFKRVENGDEDNLLYFYLASALPEAMVA